MPNVYGFLCIASDKTPFGGNTVIGMELCGCDDGSDGDGIVTVSAIPTQRQILCINETNK